MLEWYEFVEQLIQSESIFGNLRLSLNEDLYSFRVPPIIKASILMLDEMIQNQGKYNIFVFPERVHSIFIFTLMKLFHNITEGKIEKEYDLSSFQLKDKLKIGNAVVEFRGTEEREGKSRIKIGFADGMTESAPSELFPLFQKTNTQRRLSTYKQYHKAKNKVENTFSHIPSKQEHLTFIADYKTHMTSSIFNMTPIIRAKETIEACRIYGKKLSDLVLIGQVDYTGTIKNVGAGQLTGTPSIVLAPDVYSIVAASNDHNPVQSIILDISDSNRVISQLDQLDELMRLDVPITCLTDVVNSFDLDHLKIRGFNIWRWDKSSITPKMYDTTDLSLDRKTKNCATQEVKYLTVDGHEISRAISILVSYRNESREQSPAIMRMFGSLNELTFASLREIDSFGINEIRIANKQLDSSLQTLESEKHYLSSKTYEDYKEVISCLKKIYSLDYKLPKNGVVLDHLEHENYNSICIVVPEKSNKTHVQLYWQNCCQHRGLNTKVHVLYPTEYYSATNTSFSATLVVGWLNRAVMKKIIFSFNTQKYIVLLYDYEEQWKNYSTNKWYSILGASDNKAIITDSFNNDHVKISTHDFTENQVPVFPETNDVDELKEIELVLRENNYRQYVLSDYSKQGGATAEAVPVNFAGRFLALYKTGHKVISATKVILEDADKIDVILPNKLQIGDFVVVREADRDLIKEMADNLLSNSNKSNLRYIASKWKEALERERLHSSPERIFHKLKNVGCTREYPTVRSWILDEDVIAPQKREDLHYIFLITGNDLDGKLVDQVFEAGKVVKSAHVKAGRILSSQLRKKIVEELEAYEDIDPFNIWEPIEMTIEGIGPVKILKIIEIGSPINVDVSYTNRLLEEE